MMLQVVFPTFDPPEVPASMGGVGHLVSVFLDLKNQGSSFSIPTMDQKMNVRYACFDG